MDEGEKDTSPSYDAYPLDMVALLRTTLIGVGAGALGWGLYLLIAQYFILPVFCQSAETFSLCQNGGTLAWVSAHVIVLAAAVAVLAKMAVYRPLLIALAVLISLWGAQGWLGGMTWYIGLMWQAVLFGVAFAVFGWLARTANFIVALMASLVVVVIARVILMLT